MTFAFSLGNVTRLCLDLGITAWIAWLVGPAVDLSVIGLLTGMRFLSLHGYTDAQLAKLRRMLRFCGLLTLALNTAGALGHRQFGTALVDAVGPALLIGWSEVGPWLLRQIYAVCPPVAPEQPEATPAATRLAGDPGQAARPGPGARRRAPRGDRPAHLPRHPPRAAADRPRPGQRPGRRRPRRVGSRRGGVGAIPSHARDCPSVCCERHSPERTSGHRPLRSSRLHGGRMLCRVSTAVSFARRSSAYLTVIYHGDIGCALPLSLTSHHRFPLRERM